MTTLEITRPAKAVAWTDTYYNGGVEGRPLAEWYDSEFAMHFDAMDFSADLPDPAVPTKAAEAPEQAVQDLCATCRLCVDGSIFETGPAGAIGATPVPGKTYACKLLGWARSGQVGAEFAAQTVRAAHVMQAQAIEGFVTAMPEHFGTLRPATALQAEEHYKQGRALGVAVKQPERDSAWFHFETYRKFIRLNFESGFLRE
jgi:hypothetical protein